MRWTALVLLAACHTKDLPHTGNTDSGVGPDSELPDDSTAPQDQDGDGVAAEQDCDDLDPSVYPGADELCDGKDNNCDGATDEGVQGSYYSDTDGDGYGAGDPQLACEPPTGSSDQTGDCDDGDPSVHPNASEADCTDPKDYNCDGSVGYADADGDGYAACEECDDTTSTTNPGATEICDNIDNNCDSAVDEGVTDTYYRDADGDGFGDPDLPTQACSLPSGYAEDRSDCQDADASIHPNATEICDSQDNDCDTLIDDADPSLDLGSAVPWYEDADSDGYGDADSSTLSCDQPSGFVSDDSDCDDSDLSVNPGATEICDSTDTDEDCDGLSDDDDGSVDSGGFSTWYSDSDGDSYGDSSSPLSACDQPAASSSDTTDCDDSDNTVYPSATELCDGLDNDCDGEDDTLGYWAFDEGSGSAVSDSGPLGLNGTVTSGTWTTGYSGSAIDFNGSSTYVALNHSELGPQTGLTLSAWSRPDSLQSSSWNTIISRGASGSSVLGCCGDSYYLGYYLRAASFYTDTTSSNSELSDKKSYSAHIGSWHHMLATWDPNTGARKVYVDGVLTASDSKGPTSMIYDGTQTVIGADTNSGGRVLFFDGAIDEVKIFNCPVSASQAAADYSGGWPF